MSVDSGAGQNPAVIIIPCVGNLSDNVRRKPPIVIGAITMPEELCVIATIRS
jgi:hypothetical protein